MKFDEDFLNEVNSKVNLLEYASSVGYRFKKQSKEYFTCCPLHTDNTPSLSISNSEPAKFYCFSCGVGGGIISWLTQIEKMKFPDAVKKAAQLANVDISKLLRSTTMRYIKNLKRVEDKSDKHNVLPDDFMEQYSNEPITLWENEGIEREVLKDFGVRIDKEKNRIVYPVYSSNNELINVKGRTLYENFKDLKIPKYINYFKVNTLDYLQGFKMTEQYICSTGEIILFESIKSVMKAWCFGNKNSVSVESHCITDGQLKLIVKLGVNVTLAFDKDVDISSKKVLNQIKRLCRFTNVYVIKDKDNLLGDKDAPVDCGKAIWGRLYREKKRVI